MNIEPWICDERIGMIAVYRGPRRACLDGLTIGKDVALVIYGRRIGGNWAVPRYYVDLAHNLTSILNRIDKPHKEMMQLVIASYREKLSEGVKRAALEAETEWMQRNSGVAKVIEPDTQVDVLGTGWHLRRIATIVAAAQVAMKREEIIESRRRGDLPPEQNNNTQPKEGEL